MLNGGLPYEVARDAYMKSVIFSPAVELPL